MKNFHTYHYFKAQGQESYRLVQYKNGLQTEVITSKTHYIPRTGSEYIQIDSCGIRFFQLTYEQISRKEYLSLRKSLLSAKQVKIPT